MTSSEFTLLFEEQMARCESILLTKRDEYATADVLSNFKSAAGLIRSTPRATLAGMMLKHTVSIYDMCREPEPRGIDVWDEKITDHINYLILLRACVEEEINNKTTEVSHERV